jgi:hypothetical protein
MMQFTPRFAAARRAVRWFVAALLAGMALGVAQPAHAQTKAPKADPKDAKKSKDDSNTTYPISGKIKAVNRATGAFSVPGAPGEKGDRVYYVSNLTRVTKMGRPATLADAVMGDDASGTARKLPDGRMEALILRLGNPDDKDPKAKKK